MFEDVAPSNSKMAESVAVPAPTTMVVATSPSTCEVGEAATRS
jgi:hypothetical protein